MIEIIIKEEIFKVLEQENLGLNVKDFPINIVDYSPNNPSGEILIKPLGYKPIQYLDENNQISAFNIKNFPVYEFQFRIDIICKKLRTQDEIIEITTKINNALNKATINSHDAGNFRAIDIGEIMYDEDARFQYRVMIFNILVLLPLE